MKKLWKRTAAALLAALLCMSLLVGCGSNVAEEDTADEQTEEQTESTDIQEVLSVGALNGPTAMGMANMFEEEDKYTFTFAASPDEIVPMIVQGQLDIAAVPANLAATLYQRTEKGVSVIAINTLGVLYMVERGETVQSVEDLRGRTIYASGKGATPEYALNSVLEANGINPETDVTIEYKTEHAEVVSALAADESAIGLLPQPFVTTAMMKDDQMRVALDLNELWESGNDDGSQLVTGVAVVRNEVLEEHPEAVAAFMEDYKASVEFVNENVEEAAKIIGTQEIVPEQVAVQAIPQCRIVCIDGEEMKTTLSGYLSTLNAQNPEIIGGQMPDEDFYYIP